MERERSVCVCVCENMPKEALGMEDSGPLGEQSRLLTAKPSPQPHSRRTTNNLYTVLSRE